MSLQLIKEKKIANTNVYIAVSLQRNAKKKVFLQNFISRE